MRNVFSTTATFIFGILLLRSTCGRPTTPVKPIGPIQSWVGMTDTFRTVSTDRQGRRLRYVLDWGGTFDTSDLMPSGDTVRLAHEWTTEGDLGVKALAITEDWWSSLDWSDPLQVTVGTDQRPATPDPILSDPPWPTPGQNVVLWTKATDPDGDSIFMKFFYDADSNPNWSSSWRGPVPGAACVYDTVCYLHYRDAPYRLFALARDWKGGRMGLISDTSASSYIPPFGPRIHISWRYPRTGSNAGSGTWALSPAVAVLPDQELRIYAPPFDDSITVFDDTGSRNPRVHRRVFEAGSGTAPADAPALSSDRQRFYVPADDGRMYCFSAGSDLTLLSRFPGDTSYTQVFSSPAVSGEYLYAARGDSLACLRDNAGTLEPVWSLPCYAEVLFPPAVSSDGARIFFGTDSGDFICVDNSGHEHWRSADGGDVTSACAIGADGTVFVGREDGRLYGYGPEDSVPVFTGIGKNENVVGCPVIDAAGATYTVREDASVQAYRCSGQNVAPIWDAAPVPNGSATAAPCLAPDTTIVIHTADDELLALRCSDGGEKWSIALPTQWKRRFDIGDIGSSPTIAPGLPLIYVGSDNEEYFFAVEVDYDSYLNGLPNAPWPKYQHDIANSGCKGGTWYY